MALINLRNASMTGKRLPYDAEVEYLESTGTQWIDTGYVYNADSKFVCDAMLMSVPSDIFATMFGAVESYNGVFLALNNKVPIQARFGAKSVGNIVSDLSVQNAVGVRHKYELSARRLAIDDDVFTRSGFTPYTVNRPIWLCSCNDSEPVNLNRRPCSLRVYTFAIYNGNVLVRDYIPVRVGTTGEMYDRVSGTFMERHGDFVFGPDVSASNRGGGYKRKCVRRSYRRSSRPSYPPLAGGRNPWGRDQAERSEGRARFWRRTLWKEVA